MNTSAVRRLPAADRLLYWVREREAIRLKKEAGEPSPWTDDEILGTYRFTNVRRMDDRVSQWLLANWYEPYRDHPNMIYAAALARFVNKIETLDAAGFPKEWRPDLIKSVLRAIKGKGEKYLNGAYVVTGQHGTEKISSIVDNYVSPLVNLKSKEFGSSMESGWGVLMKFTGFGSFMAGQVVADLRWALTGAWRDRNRWAPQGPGSTRGLARLLGLDPSVSMSSAVWRERFDDVLETVFNQLPWEVRSRMEAMDCQNCLCEYDKYERALWGEGKPKQLYRTIRDH